MAKIAVIKSGGKQYLVKEKDEIYVDHLPVDKDEKVKLEALAVFDPEKKDIDIGIPNLKEKIEAQVVENVRGEKIRVARFKAKVRYRKVKGFRPSLSKIRILKI